MKNYIIGRKYHAIDGNKEGSFTILKKKEVENFFLKWDDQEMITVTKLPLLIQWRRAWLEKQGLDSTQLDQEDFLLGEGYQVITDQLERRFTLIEKRRTLDYVIIWEGNDHETITDSKILDKWTEAWVNKHGLEQSETEGTTRRNVKVHENVKEDLENLKYLFNFRSESDVIQALIELYNTSEQVPQRFVQYLLQHQRR